MHLDCLLRSKHDGKTSIAGIIRAINIFDIEINYPEATNAAAVAPTGGDQGPGQGEEEAATDLSARQEGAIEESSSIEGLEPLFYCTACRRNAQVADRHR